MVGSIVTRRVERFDRIKLALPKSIQPPRSEASPAASAYTAIVHCLLWYHDLHHRALSNLVVGGLVLEGRVAGVVLVLISWQSLARLLWNLHIQKLTLGHGVGSRVDSVKDDKACDHLLTLFYQHFPPSNCIRMTANILFSISSSSVIRDGCSRRTGDVEGPHGLGCSWASVSCGIPSISLLRAARSDVPICAGNLRPRRGMLAFDGEAMGGYAGAVGDGS